MNDTQFWKIIERAKTEADGDPDAIAQGMHGHLIELPAVEIESFAAILRGNVAAAYTWTLWAAAYLLNGSCSDDGFEYFRGWLVAQGQKVYEAALANPDSLAKVADPENDQHECEDILYAPTRAYEAVAGKQLPVPAGSVQAPEPSGDNWDFDDQEATARQLPRLARMYGR
jgi:hypothetical protein